MLIRRFEERAGEMYAKAKVGGFLHLAIGEEATIVGACRAMRDEDYLISTYRSHGHALARGSDPDRVMAELFGREEGVSHGRGGSMHMFDLENRFMGGYGIVGGNLPLAAGMALASDYQGLDEVTVCVFGDGAANQGTFGETLNLAALWKLPVVFMVTNNQFGMGTAIERHSAVTDLHRRGEGFGVPGLRCDGMDVVETYTSMREAIRRAREDRQPILVEAVTYRFRGHSMADPEEYRTKEQVAEWRKRDPINAFAERLLRDGVLEEGEPEQLDEAAVERVDEAVDVRRRAPRSRRRSRSTTTSTCSATRSRAGTRSTSGRPACTAASTSARWPRPSAGPTGAQLPRGGRGGEAARTSRRQEARTDESRRTSPTTRKRGRE